MSKNILSLTAACAAAAALSAPAAANTETASAAASETTAETNAETTTETKAEIVERGPDGRATSVRIDGKVYEVCGENTQTDCINPRAAGLDWGDRPIEYWPGKPASEIEGPLPAKEGG